MKKECCRCESFKAYYSKAYCCYLREDFGRCSKKKEIVNKHSCCKNWKIKTVDAQIKRGVVINNLAEAITNIAIIKEFLEEHNEN